MLIKSAWRNWQTHMTQNHAGNRVGSIPTAGTNFIYLTLIKALILLKFSKINAFIFYLTYQLQF